MANPVERDTTAAARRRRWRPTWRVLELVMLAGVAIGCVTPTLLNARARSLVREHDEKFRSEGQEISVDHFAPTAPGRHPAVLLLHGSGGLHLIFGKTIESYAEALAAQGFHAYVVHYFDGTDTFTADDDDERRFYGDWEHVVSDAVSYVAAQPDVRPRQISVLGVSLGAYLAVGAAAQDPRIAAAVIVSGGLEPFLRDSLPRMPPTLILHGDDDHTVPVQEAYDLAKYFDAHHFAYEMHVYHGEDHQLSDSAALDALNRAQAFLTRKRSNDPRLRRARGRRAGNPLTDLREMLDDARDELQMWRHSFR